MKVAYIAKLARMHGFGPTWCTSSGDQSELNVKAQYMIEIATVPLAGGGIGSVDASVCVRVQIYTAQDSTRKELTSVLGHKTSVLGHKTLVI